MDTYLREASLASLLQTLTLAIETRNLLRQLRPDEATELHPEQLQHTIDVHAAELQHRADLTERAAAVAAHESR